MFDTCKPTNKLITKGLSILFQVVFIFTFLTIFFFVYVVSIEKGEFKDQMNYVVDQIFDDNKYTILKNAENVSKDQIVGVVSGVIDEIEFSSENSSKKSDDIVNDKNDEVRSSAFKILSVVLIILVVIVSILMVVGYCTNLHHNISESLWVILFVGLTELAFLQIVAKNYISADPNNVKRVIGSSIEKWIKENK
mgnify:FL=1|uniref:Uncharacterized protein n=1 Tax=viral metagenome TaxID=1070528 RepID=A0A6C0LV96_9ZZZZ